MTLQAPDLYHPVIHGVIEIRAAADGDMNVVEIHTRDESYRGVTWLPAQPAEPDCVQKARVTTVPVMIEGVDEPIYIVTSVEDTPDRDVFDLIPDRFGRDEGVVYRCRDAVDIIQSAALRRFMSSVFSLTPVFRYYWTCPASQRHHHSRAGGLALHSVEMAEGIVKTPHLSIVERDFGIAYALLHDVGKIWCYRTDGRYGDPLGHEMAALNHLHAPLWRLAADWPDAAVAMRSFLSGLWKQSGHRPIMAVGRLVQALDQVSAEADLRRHPGLSRRAPWCPDIEPWPELDAPPDTAKFRP